MLAEKMHAALDHAKKRHGVKRQEEFALRVGMTPDRLRNIRGDKIKKLTPEEVRNIEAAFDIRRAWWTSDNAPMLLTEEEQSLKTPLSNMERASGEAAALGLDGWHARVVQELLYNVQSGRGDAIRQQLEQLKGSAAPLEFVTVPRHAVTASAGAGMVVNDESVVDHLAFKRTWVTQSLGVDPSHLALIDAHGDSMSPTIESGDLLLLDTRHAQPRSEGIYVINLGGALLVKRLRIKLSGVVEVMSDNPRYETEALSGAGLEQLVIVGRVVWHGRKV